MSEQSKKPGTRDVIIPPGTTEERELALVRGILDDHHDVIRRNERLVAVALKQGLLITYDSDITSPHYGEILTVARTCLHARGQGTADTCVEPEGHPGMHSNGSGGFWAKGE